MADQTPRMKWVIPSENSDGWYEKFVALFGEVDASVYASREDRNLILMGGGTITWDGATSNLQWTEEMAIFSPNTGFRSIVAAGSVKLESDGQLVYATIVRNIVTKNPTVASAVGTKVPVSPAGNDQILLCLRYDGLIYWRNGLVMQDGDSVTNFLTTVNFGGDLAEPTAGTQMVVGLQGRALADTAPTDGQTIVWNDAGSTWQPGAGGGGSITLGGDLDDWVPTPSSAEQRVVGLNTIPIPEEAPEHGDILQAQSPLMLSQFPFDITSDGTRVWVGDTQSPSSAVYGGLPSVLFDDDYISLRYDYSAGGLGGVGDYSIWSVVYLDGYLYVTGLSVGVFITSPVLLKIDPADGTIQDGAIMAGMAYVRTDGTYLYLLIPHGAKNETVFYWVDPADLSTQTAIDANPSPYAQAGFVDFAYDDVLGKVWLVANNSGHLLRVDGTTHAIDFAVTTVDQPTAIEYGAGYLWVADDSEADDYYTPGYSGYGSTPEVKVVDPTDGSVVATVTDGYGLIKGVLRSVYDPVNGKLWVVCDQPIYFGDNFAGPRLVRVDVATQTVDGWCNLDSLFNMAIIVAGGYVWIVDSPGGNPSAGGVIVETILKIDPGLVDYQDPDPPIGDPVPPADAIVARITSGSLAYVFVKQNQELTITATADYDIQNADAVIVCMYGVDVNLPQNPVIGQRHTIVDGEGTAASSDIDIDYWDPDYYGGNYRPLAAINTAYGSKTFVYSSVGWVEV